MYFPLLLALAIDLLMKKALTGLDAVWSG